MMHAWVVYFFYFEAPPRAEVLRLVRDAEQPVAHPGVLFRRGFEEPVAGRPAITGANQ